MKKNQTKTHLAGVKVGDEVTDLVSLGGKVLKAHGYGSDLRPGDGKTQVDIYCTLIALGVHLPTVIADAKKFVADPSHRNLVALEAGLQAISDRMSDHLLGK